MTPLLSICSEATFPTPASPVYPQQEVGPDVYFVNHSRQQMGDAPSADRGSQDAQQAPPIANGHSTMFSPAQSPTASSPSHHLHSDARSNAFASQFDMTQSSANRQSSFNMDAMATALPQVGYNAPYGYNQHSQQGQYPGVAAPMPTQPFPPPQYGLQSAPAAGPPYYPQQGVLMQQYYPMPMYHAHPPSEPLQESQMQGQMPPSTYPQVPHGPRPFHYYPTSLPFATSTRPPPQISNWPASPPRKQVDPRTAPPPIVTGSSGRGIGYVDGRSPRSNTRSEASGPVDGNQGTVRGPPRKPKQRAHAVWIGNLPPHADLMDLVNHVCREAPGLNSLFLISKSNCAFANFEGEQTCITAQQRLHDSRFHSVRLVSRLRKSAAERPGIPTPGMDGPASASSSAPTSDGPACDGDAEDTQPTTTASSPAKLNAYPRGEGMSGKDRYFILKSLTIDDLETSVRNGIWATQSHNEELLNAAFKAAENVYLVFSANKSGEYFGYARMISSVNGNPEAAIEFAPTAQSADAPDLPKAIPTDATRFAPKGRIVDDSTRGTIFWEAERDGDYNGDGDKTDGEGLADLDGDAESPKSWGKPFKLEWISTTRVPFYRARGLRNPWNANREVKIARDGTELEPNVGRRLVGLFGIAQSPGFAPPAMVRPGMGGMMGYPPHPHGRPCH